MRYWTCSGWHRVNGRVEFKQWYSYDRTPCPEHGKEFLVERK